MLRQLEEVEFPGDSGVDGISEIKVAITVKIVGFDAGSIGERCGDVG
jgi:hypothetical protein